jgi:cell division protein ZipA
MPELRWALLGLGLLFLAGLALWEWRRPRRGIDTHGAAEPEVTATSSRLRRLEPRIEPRIGEFAEFNADAARSAPLELPTMRAVEATRDDSRQSESPAARPILVEVAADSAVDVPLAALPSQVPVQWPPEQTDRVLGLRIVHPRGEALPGSQLRFALLASGMRYGPQQIFHRIRQDGAVLASAANLVRPGTFEPKQMDTQEFRGLSLFSVLPGVLPDAQMLEELVVLARRIATRLAVTVQDDQGMPLDAERLNQLRRSVAAGASTDGDGAAQ